MSNLKFLLLLVFICNSGVLVAQTLKEVIIKTEKLSDHVYMLTGRG